ncbi:MAG: ribonuclease III [Sulfurospirillum sp.]|jgi:ribonuclease-3|nr:ribonuclease III [Sulfurospirillum sp.]MBP9613119.1 ribonuclease III [Sulfurospirillum sp.]
MYKALDALQKRLGYQFKDQNLIIEALTHKSSKQPYNNERLEFLGDAVLDLIVGEYLYHEFKDVAEGELSKLRASLVNEKSFEKLARLLHLGEHIYISLAEENNCGREKSSLLSNAFEALIGALYLEAGLEKARSLAIELLEEAYPKIDMDAIFRDHKTTLQELTQAHYGVTPEYRLVRSFGPDHKKEFEIAVSIKGNDLALASGKSKKEAQQKAAMIALEILKKEHR